MKGNRVYILVVMLALALGVYVTEATAQPTVLTVCGNVGTGSYVLGNNISTTGTCLTLNGDDITIDLNGFTIDGDDGAGDVGITFGSFQRRNIVIRNGTIRDFDIGVGCGSCVDSKVEWILAFSNGIGIQVGNNSNVSHNIANSNSDRGIVHDMDCTISYNIANNNNSGIASFNIGSNIIYNTANGNVNVGINVFCPSNLVGNIAQNNGTNLLQNGPGCKRYNNLF